MNFSDLLYDVTAGWRLKTRSNIVSSFGVFWGKKAHQHGPEMRFFKFYGECKHDTILHVFLHEVMSG